MSFGRDDNCPDFLLPSWAGLQTERGPEETRVNLHLVHGPVTRGSPPFTCEIVYWVSPPSATSETGRAWRGSRCIIIIQRFYYSADMIYYSVNCLCAVTWVDETPVRNGAIWWNGISLSCPISSLWASVCINMVAIHSLVDLFFFFRFCACLPSSTVCFCIKTCF